MVAERRQRVLLVEDDDDNRELMVEVLEGAGFDVRAAATGADGAAALAAEPFDVVVTDVGMPGMGGLELARAAKQRPAPIPVIVVTGYAEREDIATAQGHEVDVVLLKPVDPDALAATVVEVLAASSEPTPP